MVAALAVGLTFFAAAAPAQAISGPTNCNTHGRSQSNYLEVSVVVSPVTCSAVQARMDRYVSGTVYTFLGASSNQISTVSQSQGTHAGSWVRTNYSSVWTAWTAVAIGPTFNW